MQKAFVFIVFGCMVSIMSQAQPEVLPGKLDLFLCIGQSNMAGRARIPDSLDRELTGIYLLNDKDEWEIARNPLNRYSTIRKSDPKLLGLSPSYEFSRELSKENTAIGMVVNARGGTAIELWQKDHSSNYYQEALRRIKQALQKSPGARLRGIIWHQGESDCKESSAYKEALKTLIKDLREDLEAPNLSFIAGELGYWDESCKAINEILTELEEEIDSFAYVSAEGLTHFDGLHFDAASQLEFGKRFAKKLLQLEKKE